MIARRRVRHFEGQRELDALFLECATDRKVDPFVEGEEVPIAGRVIPIDDLYVEGVRVEVVEINSGRKRGIHPFMIGEDFA